MDFVKKNVAWIALIALGVSIYLLYQARFAKTTTTTTTGEAGSFAGKKNVTNPVNQ